MENSAITADEVERIVKDHMPSAQVLEALKFHNSIREQLNREKDFIKESFLSGSYARDTTVVHKSKSKKNGKTCSDVDIDIVVVSPPDAPPSLVLKIVHLKVDKIMQALGNQYATRRQDRSIGVDVTVNGLQAHFDIVPLKINNDNKYLICDGQGSDVWHVTDPKAAIQQTKYACEVRPKLRPLIRLMKIWNYTYGEQRPFKSFHLECLVIWICDTHGLLKNNEQQHWNTVLPLCFNLMWRNYANPEVRAPGSGATLCAYLKQDRLNRVQQALRYAEDKVNTSAWSSLFAYIE